MRQHSMIGHCLSLIHIWQDADAIRKLVGEANNINQLAHRANAGGFALVAVELVKLKDRIVEIINHLSDEDVYKRQLWQLLFYK